MARTTSGRTGLDIRNFPEMEETSNAFPPPPVFLSHNQMKGLRRKTRGEHQSATRSPASEHHFSGLKNLFLQDCGPCASRNTSRTGFQCQKRGVMTKFPYPNEHEGVGPVSLGCKRKPKPTKQTRIKKPAHNLKPSCRDALRLQETKHATPPTAGAHLTPIHSFLFVNSKVLAKLD